MAVLDIIPKSNISLADIRDTINEKNGASATNIISTFIDEDSNLNQWARYKPLKGGADFYSTLADYEAYAKTINWGLKPPSGASYTGTSISDDKIKQLANNMWIYDKPELPTDKFRVGDFRGYYPKAVPFIQTWPSTIEVNKVVSPYGYIGIDTDPDDSEYNLQASDFSNSGTVYDLKKTKLVAIVVDTSGTTKLRLESSDYILDSDGETQGIQLAINCRNLSSGTYNVYVVLKYNDGASSSSTWYSLPNRGIHTLKVISDSSSAGFGINDAYADVAFAPSFGQTFYTANNCTDGGSGTKKTMRNTTGEVLVRVKFTNSTSSAKTLSRSSFTFKALLSGTNYRQKTPEYMWSTNPSGTSGSVSSVTIPAKGTATVWLYHSTLLSLYTGTSQKADIEFTISYNGQELWGEVLYYIKGATGWA